MVKYIINRRKSPSDTRHAYGVLPEKQDLYLDSLLHIRDVKMLGNVLTELMIHDIGSHDWTKLKYIDDFHKDFTRTVKQGENFIKLKWFSKIHINLEPHHPIEYTGNERIMLIHFDHLTCDWVAAAKARNPDGKCHFQNFDEDAMKEALWQAFLNQLKFLDNITTVRQLPDRLSI